MQKGYYPSAPRSRWIGTITAQSPKTFYRKERKGIGAMKKAVAFASRTAAVLQSSDSQEILSHVHILRTSIICMVQI